MKYLCPVYLGEDRVAEPLEEECVAYDAGIRDSGHRPASEAPESVAAKTKAGA